MLFHFGFELPQTISKELDHESSGLTDEEVRILKKQIRSNAVMIDQYVGRLELLVNKERYPGEAVFIQKIRRQLELLMEENDTFRGVLWKHFQTQDIVEKTRHEK